MDPGAEQLGGGGTADHTGVDEGDAQGQDSREVYTCGVWDARHPPSWVSDWVWGLRWRGHTGASLRAAVKGGVVGGQRPQKEKCVRMSSEGRESRDVSILFLGGWNITKGILGELSFKSL